MASPSNYVIVEGSADVTPKDIMTLSLEQLFQHGWNRLRESQKLCGYQPVVHKVGPLISPERDTEIDAVAEAINATGSAYAKQNEPPNPFELRALLLQTALESVRNCPQTHDPHVANRRRRSHERRTPASQKEGTTIESLLNSNKSDEVIQYITSLFDIEMDPATGGRDMSGTAFESVADLLTHLSTQPGTVLGAFIQVLKHVIARLLASKWENHVFIFRCFLPLIHCLSFLPLKSHHHRELFELLLQIPIKQGSTETALTETIFSERLSIDSKASYVPQECWSVLLRFPYARKVSITFTEVTNPAHVHCMWVEPDSSWTVLEPAAGNCHEFGRGSLYVKSLKASVFQASVRVEVAQHVHAGWQAELQYAVVKALLTGVKVVFEDRPAHRPPNLRTAMNLFANGLTAPQPLHPSLAVRLLRCAVGEDDEIDSALKKICIPKSAVIGFRASLAALCATLKIETIADERLQEVIKKLQLLSDSLRDGDFCVKFAEFVISEGVPNPQLSVGSAVEALRCGYVFSQKDPKRLIDILKEHRTYGQAICQGLQVLIDLSRNLRPEQFSALVFPFRGFLKQGHYLSAVQGSGSELECTIRGKTHAVLATIFQALRALRSGNSVQPTLPHRMVRDALPYGAFAVNALSLLTSEFDEDDLNMIQGQISSILLEMLPSATEFARSNTLQVDDEAEADVTTAWKQLAEVDSISQVQGTPSRIVSPGSSDPFTVSGKRRWGLATEAWDLSGRGSKPLTYVEFTFVSGADPHSTVAVGLIPERSKEGLGFPISEAVAGGILVTSKGEVFAQTEGKPSRRLWCPWLPGETIGIALVKSPGHARLSVYLFKENFPLGFIPDCVEPSVIPVMGVIQGADATVKVEYGPNFAQECRIVHPGVRVQPTANVVSSFSAKAFHLLMARTARLAKGLPVKPNEFSGSGSFLLVSSRLLLQYVESAVNRLQSVSGPAVNAVERVERETFKNLMEATLLSHLASIRSVMCCKRSNVLHLNLAALTEVLRADNCLPDSVTCSTLRLLTDFVKGFCSAELESSPPDQKNIFAEIADRAFEMLLRPKPTPIVKDRIRWGNGPLFHGPNLQVHSHGSVVSATTSARKQHSVHNAAFGAQLPSTPVCRFHITINREGMPPGETLGRYYFIGVSTMKAIGSDFLSDYVAGESLLNGAKEVYAVPDVFGGKVPKGMDEPERQRFKANWRRSDGMCFGVGDMITVEVDRSKGTVSFSRNDRPLGTLYRNLKLDVPLFPFVGVFNGDASATIMAAAQPPAAEVEKERNLQKLIRMLLLCAPSQPLVVSKLVELIGNSSIEALKILGSDEKEDFCPSVEAQPQGLTEPCFPQTGADDMGWPKPLTGALAEQILNYFPCSDTALSLMHPRFGLRLLKVFSSIPAKAISVEMRKNLESHLFAITKVGIPTSGRRPPPLQEGYGGPRRMSPTSRSPTAQGRVKAAFDDIQFLSLLKMFDGIPDEEVLEEEIPFQNQRRFPSATVDMKEWKCPQCEERWVDAPSATSTCGSRKTHFTPVCDLESRNRQGKDLSFSLSGVWKAVDGSATFNLEFSNSYNGDVSGDGSDSKGTFAVKGNLVNFSRLDLNLAYDYAKAEPAGSANQEEESSDSEWACEVCTFLNAVDANRCAMCSTARPGATWSCGQCTYKFNGVSSGRCEVCGCPKSVERASGVQPEKKFQVQCTQCRTRKDIPSFQSFSAMDRCSVCSKNTTFQFADPVHATLKLAFADNSGTRLAGKLMVLGSTTDMTLVLNQKISEESAPATKWIQPLPAVLLQHEEPDSGFSPEEAEEEPFLALMRAMRGRGRGGVPSPGGGRTDFEAFLAARGGRGGGRPIPSREDSEETEESTGPETSPVTHTPMTLHETLSELLQRLVRNWLPAMNAMPIPEFLYFFLVATRNLPFQEACETALSLPSSLLASLNDHIHSLAVAQEIPDWAVADAVFVTHLQTAIAEMDGISHANWNPSVYTLAYLALTSKRQSTTVEAMSALSKLVDRRLVESSNEIGSGSSLRYVMKVMSLDLSSREFTKLCCLLRLGGCMGELPTTESTSLCRLLLGVQRVSNKQKLPAVFDTDIASTTPFLIPLPQTTMTENGRLVTGQVKGSIGVYPAEGGRYYYEVVVPNMSHGRVGMGWGTNMHAIEKSTVHVGADVHSWGYTLKASVWSLGGETEYLPPTRVMPGDVVGSILDLDQRKVCWLLNGVQMPWLEVPIGGDGEAIFPFVSASVSPSSIQIRLANCRDIPESCRDFTSVVGKPLESVPATRTSSSTDCLSPTVPQNFEFYKELAALVDESGLSLAQLGEAARGLNTTDSHPFAAFNKALTGFPTISALCSTQPATPPMTILAPYLRHLSSLSELGNIASPVVEAVKGTSLWTIYCQAKELFVFQARWGTIEKLLSTSVNRTPPSTAVLTLDREAATQALSSGQKGEIMSKSIFSQVFSATKNRENLFTQLIMFTVTFKHVSAEDHGGLYRSCFSLMSEEIMFVQTAEGQRLPPRLPLFQCADHSTYFNLVPNPSCKSDEELAMFQWLGKVLGNAVLTGSFVLSVNFPRLLWKFLLEEDINIEHYFADCNDSARGSLSSEEFLLSDDFFESLPDVRNWCTAEALKSPQDYSEDASKLSEIAAARRDAAERCLIHQYDTQLLSIRKGFRAIVPAQALTEMTWKDLQRRVCGNPSVTVSDFLAQTDLAMLKPNIRDMFVAAVTEMTDETRATLLLFSSGQPRLPLPEKIKVTCGDNPEAIPTAHTCSPITLTIQPYGSSAILRQKLAVAVTHAYEYGFV